MRRFFRACTLALALFASTTDGVLRYTWMWVSMPGQPYGGSWTLVAVEPYFGT